MSLNVLPAKSVLPANQNQVSVSHQVNGLRIKREHVYELDPLRALTALIVVGVHVLAFTTFLSQSNRIGLQIQDALVVSTHFTRALFMFVTAFAMVYVYAERKLSYGSFLKKRVIGVVIPYIIWSVAYTYVDLYIWSSAPFSIISFVQTSALNVLTGKASYQLYFILLSVQFYLLLPLFLGFLSRVKNHPWLVLGCSFAVQVLIFYADYHYVVLRTFEIGNLLATFNKYQDSLILIYPFYFILGGICALYFQQLRAFLRRHGAWLVGVMLLALGVLWIHFYQQITVDNELLGFAVSVLQPVMVMYSCVVIIFAFWLVCRWTMKLDSAGHPKWYRFWQWLGEASFGIYLVHALLLTFAIRHIIPGMPQLWPVALRVFLIWLFTAVCSVSISVVLMNIPIVSRLVGRSRPLPQWLVHFPQSVQRGG
jgi:probable poly-beta-1,6-N-acetyl-D-glucosamine export protein